MIWNGQLYQLKILPTEPSLSIIIWKNNFLVNINRAYHVIFSDTFLSAETL